MTTPAQPGLTPLTEFNQPDKTAAIEIIRGLLCNRPRNVISYTQTSALANNNQQYQHLYRFFVNTQNGLFNISGLVTLVFGLKLNDRSCTVSVTQQTAEQDIQSFTTALRKALNLSDLVLEDLIGSAQDTLNWTINPSIREFLVDEQQ